MARGTALAIALLLPAGGLLACSGEPEVPDPGPVSEELASALEAGEVSDVVRDGAAAQEQLDRITAGLGDTGVRVDVLDAEPQVVPEGGDAAPTEADVTLRWAWDVAPDGGGPWEYRARATLVRDDVEDAPWEAEWERTVVHPDLRAGETLDLVPLAPLRGDVVGAGGRALVTLRPVTRFGITRDQVEGPQVARSARRLARLVGVDPGPYAKRVAAAGDRAFVEAIVLRRDEVPVDVGRGYPTIPGALAVKDELPLAPTSDFAAPILGRVGPVTAEMVEEDPSLGPGDVRGLSGLQSRYDDLLAGTPGVLVRARSDDRTRDLHRVEAVPGEDLRVSLDERLQRAAERILEPVGPSSALVALRPSDGALLTAANGPGTTGVNVATFGQAPPGSTFKTVSALALLRAGLGPGSPVRCTDTVVVDGRRFGNYDDYPPGGLGTIPLRTAVAFSCNTAFIARADEVGRDGLARAAASLGLGVDHDLGFPAYFGQVPEPRSQTEAAADMIGQGGILASPMAMATVMASVAEGSTVVPWLLDDVRSQVPGDVEPLTGGQARQLRSMLRGVVTDGSGSGLADVPGPPVVAKTGTAEFDRDGRRLLHAWMVAAQGDLAVAVFVDRGASGSRTAGPLLEAFLRATGEDR
jgi:hypothetical protein